jgi:predicted DNA-binding protein
MSTKGKQVQVSLYLPPELARRLKVLSDRTRVPQAEYFREAVRDVLVKYEASKREGGKRG